VSGVTSCCKPLPKLACGSGYYCPGRADEQLRRHDLWRSLPMRRLLHPSFRDLQLSEAEDIQREKDDVQGEYKKGFRRATHKL
jgi:hypothetical protein